ncbi:MAG: hypothetical protein ABSG13_18375 [Bryobacteraceae bacterium]|jgi:hypothetical protein
MIKTLLVATALVGSAAILSAQAIDPDTYKVNYFSDNLSICSGIDNGVTCNVPTIPLDTVRVTNVGTSGGNLCADIYVFDPYQELAECCSCKITPDGLLTLSVSYNLTSNTLTGVPLSTGVIKMVSSSTCNASAPKPAPGIRAWGTHVQTGGTWAETETEFQDAGLSAVELSRLSAECSAIQLDGSGHGLCSCGTIPPP